MNDDLIARARSPLPPHDAPCPLDYVENALRMATRIEQLQRELATVKANRDWHAENYAAVSKRLERAEAELQRLTPTEEDRLGAQAAADYLDSISMGSLAHYNAKRIAALLRRYVLREK